MLTATGYGQASRLKKIQEATTATNSNSEPSAPQVQAAPNSELLATVTEETIPEPPVISWDGKELTIDAENATLSSILLGIRSRTGASIEMPPSTNSDRVAVHLGPAPMREVLSSLLYGTDFNYVIQSSDADENTLEKVIISAKDSDPTDDSSSTATTAASDRHVRLMPGYGAPGKRDFEVEHQKAVEAAQQDDSSTAGLTVTQDPASTPDSPADNARASAADSSSAPPASTDSANGGTPAGDVAVQVAEQTQSSAGGSSGASGGAGLNKMEQDLQHMYQQRQQIQAEQNRSRGQASN
jgi:hypothetical protein